MERFIKKGFVGFTLIEMKRKKDVEKMLELCESVKTENLSERSKAYLEASVEMCRWVLE